MSLSTYNLLSVRLQLFFLIIVYDRYEICFQFLCTEESLAFTLEISCRHTDFLFKSHDNFQSVFSTPTHSHSLTHISPSLFYILQHVSILSPILNTWFILSFFSLSSISLFYFASFFLLFSLSFFFSFL